MKPCDSVFIKILIDSLQIVYVGRMSPELKSFVQSLIADDVLVRTVPAGSMDCILKSQLVRLFATDMVLDEQDLVVEIFLIAVNNP